MDSESDGAFDLPPVTIPAPPVVPETGDREHFPREKPQELNVFEGEIKPTPKEAEVVKIRAADEINKLQEYQDDEEIEPPAGFGYVEAPSYIGLVEKPVDVDASIEATLETTSLDAPPAEYATEEIEEKLTKQILVEETGENADQDAAPGLVDSVLEEAKGNVEGQLDNNLIEKHFIIEPEGFTERLDAPEFSSGATEKVEELLEPASAKELGPDPEKAIEAFEQSPADEIKPEEQPKALKTKAELGLAETIEKFQETAETSTVEEPELVVKGTEVPSVEAAIEEEKPIKQPEANEEGFAAESMTEAVADREEELYVIPAESIVVKAEEEGEAKKTVAVAKSFSEAAVEQLEELEANLKVQEDEVGEEKESSLAEATEVEKVDVPAPEEKELLGELETKETADVIESSIRDASEAIPVNEEEELVQERDISLEGFTEFKGQTKATEATDVAEFSPEPTEKAAETLEAIDLTQEAAEPRAVEEPELVVVKGTEVPSAETAIEEERPIEYLEAKEEAFAAESLAEDVADPEEELDENQAGSRTEVEEEAGAKEPVAIAESPSEAVVEKLEEVGADPNVPEEGVGDEKEKLLAKATEDETLVPAPVEQELGGELDTKETADVTVSSIKDAPEAIPVKGEALLVQGRDISLADFTEEKASESSHAEEEFKGQTEATEAIEVAESSPEPTEKAMETLEAIDIGQETAETSAVEEPELVTSKETEVSKGEAATEEEKPIEQQPEVKEEAYAAKSQAELVTDPDEGLNGTIAVSILEKVEEEPGVKVTVATAESSSKAAIEQQELEVIPKAEENGAGEEKETLLAEATEDNKLDVPAPVEEELGGELETKETTDSIESSIKHASEVISVKGEEELEQGREISLADFTQEKTSESSPAAEEFKGLTQATEAIAVAATSPQPTEKAAETLEAIDIGQETAEASAVEQPELAVSKETAISSGEAAIEEKKPVELPEVKEETYAAKSTAELVTDSDEAIDGKSAESGTEKAEEEAEAKEATAIAELSSEAAVEQLEQLEANPDVEDEGVSEEKETLAAEAMEDEKLDVLTPVEEELRGELETKETNESADVIESSIKDASEAIPDKGEALLVQGRDISQADFTEEITSESSPAEEESKEQTEATEAIEVAESSTESTEKAAETLEAIDRGQETAETSVVKEPEIDLSKETEVSSREAAIEEEKLIEQPEVKEEEYAAKSRVELVTDLDEGLDGKVAGFKTEKVDEEPEVRETVATAESSSEAAIEQQEELEGIPNVEEYGTGEEKGTLLATENEKLNVSAPVEEELGGELETKANADGIEPSIEEASEAIPVREEEEAVQERDISLADVSGEKTSEPSLAEDKLKGQTEATEVIKVAESSSEPTEKAAETLEAIDIGQETAETSAVEERELAVSIGTEVSSGEAAIEEEKPIEQPEVKEEAYAAKSPAEVVTDLDEGVDEKVAGLKTEEVEEEPEVKETVAIAESSSEAAVEQLDDLETNPKVEEEGAHEEKETLVAEATQNEKLDVPAPAEEEIGAELETKAKTEGIEPLIEKIPDATSVKGEEEVVQERDISPADFLEEKTRESSPAKEEFKGETEATEAIEVAESAPEPTEKVAETIEASGELEEAKEKAKEKPEPPQVENILEEPAESGEASEAADASVETTENIEEESEAIHDVEEVKLKDTLGAESSLEEKVKAPQADEEVELTKASDVADSSLEAAAEAEAVSEEEQEQESVKDEENVAAESTGEVIAEVVPVGVKEEEESQLVETTEPAEQSPEANEKTEKLAEAAEEQETEVSSGEAAIEEEKPIVQPEVKEEGYAAKSPAEVVTDLDEGVDEKVAESKTEEVEEEPEVKETVAIAESSSEAAVEQLDYLETNPKVEEEGASEEKETLVAEVTQNEKLDVPAPAEEEIGVELETKAKADGIEPSIEKIPEATPVKGEEEVVQERDISPADFSEEKTRESSPAKEEFKGETEANEAIEVAESAPEPTEKVAETLEASGELEEVKEKAEEKPEPPQVEKILEEPAESGEASEAADASVETTENIEEETEAIHDVEEVKLKDTFGVESSLEEKVKAPQADEEFELTKASDVADSSLEAAAEAKAVSEEAQEQELVKDEENVAAESTGEVKAEVVPEGVKEEEESQPVETTEPAEQSPEAIEKTAELAEAAEEQETVKEVETLPLGSTIHATKVEHGEPSLEETEIITRNVDVLETGEVAENFEETSEGNKPVEEQKVGDEASATTDAIKLAETTETAKISKVDQVSEVAREAIEEEKMETKEEQVQPSLKPEETEKITKNVDTLESGEAAEKIKETLEVNQDKKKLQQETETSLLEANKLVEEPKIELASRTTDAVELAETTEAAEISEGNPEPEVAKAVEEDKVETSVQSAGESNAEYDATTIKIPNSAETKENAEEIVDAKEAIEAVEEKQVATSVQVASEPKAESDASINVAESAASTEKAEEIDEAREVKAETSKIETDKVIAEEALELPSKVRAKSEVITSSVPESTKSTEKAGGVVEATEATEDAQEEKAAYLVEEASEPKIESDATTNVLESVEATEKAEETVEAREVKVGTPEIETDKEVTEEEVLEHPSEEKAKADIEADSTTTIGVDESAELAEKANEISEEKEEPVSHAQAGEQPSVEVAQAIEETKAEELFEEKEGSEEVKSAETLLAEPGEGGKEKVETLIETEEELQEQTLEDEASGTTNVVKVAATTEAAETSVGNQEPEVAKETAEEEKVETSVQVAGELNVESDANTTDFSVSPEPNKKAEEILQATEAIEEEKGTTAVEVADDSNVKADATTMEVPDSAESTEKTAIVEATEAAWDIEEEKGTTSVPVADETKVEYDATTNVFESGDSTEKAEEIVEAREVKEGTPEIETDEVTEEKVLEHLSKVKAKADATTTIGVDESVKLAEKANEISEEKEEPVFHAQAGEKPSVEVAQAIEETKAEEHFEEKEGSEEVKSAEILPAEPTEGVKEVKPQADAETTTNVIASEFREVAENTEEEKEVNKEKENLEKSETQLLESHKLEEEEPKVIEDSPKSNNEVELVETTETAEISEEKQEPEEVKEAIDEDKLETLAKAAGKPAVETDAASIVVPESAESTEKAEETVEARELKVEDTTENETAGKVVEEQVLEPSGAVTTDSNVETEAMPAIDVAESTETNEKEISELEEPVPQTQGNEEQEVKRLETAEGIQTEEQFGETQGSEEVLSSETKLEEPEEGVTEEKKQEPSAEVEEKSKVEERQVDAETTTKVDVLESGEDTENTAETLAVNEDQEKLDEIETSELESNQFAEEEPNVEDKAPETKTSSSTQQVEVVVEAEKEEKLESSTQAVDEEKAETGDTQAEEHFKGKEESQEVISAETLPREPTEGVKEEKKVETSIEAEEKLKEEETQADTETTTNATEEAVEVSQEKEKLEESETQLLESNKLVEGEAKVIEEVPESNNEVELAETTETVKVSKENQEAEENHEADKVKEAIEEDKLETLAQAEVGTDAPTSNVPESAESDEKAEEIVETREVKVPETLIETADEVAEEQAVEPSSEVKADLKAETDATIAIDVSDSTETKEREILEENGDLVPQTHGDEEKEFKRQEAVKESQAEEQFGEIQGSEEVVSAETTLAESNTEEQQVDAKTTADVGVFDSEEVTENTEGTLEMNKEQEKSEEMETPQLESNKLAEEVPKVEDKAPETTEIVELAKSTEAAKTSDSNQEVEEAIVAEKEEKLGSSAQAVEEAKVETGATATDVHESSESTKKVEDILEEAEVKEEGTIENETATEVPQEAAPEDLSHVVPEYKKEADATTESAEEISETLEKTRVITEKAEEPVPHTQANEEPEFEVPEATEETPAKEPLEEHEAEEVKDTETSSVELTEGVKEGEKLAVDEEPREVGMITIDASEAAAEATEQVKETIEETAVEEPEQEMVKEREFSETPVEEEAIKDQSEAAEVIEAESKQTTIDAIESIEATEKVLEIPEETQELVRDTQVEEESNIDLPEATGKTPELLEEQEGPEEVKATQTLLVEHTEGAKEDEEPEPTIEVKEELKDINVTTTVDSEAAAEATEQVKERIEATTAGELEQEVVKEREFSQIPAEEEIQDRIPHDEKTLKDQYEATEVTEADSKEATTVDATEATTIDAPESTEVSEKVKEISEETEVPTHDTQADELSKVKVPEATEKTLIEELPEEKTEAEGVKSIENLSAELTEGVTEERKIEQSVIAEEPKEVDVNTTVAVTEASDETIHQVKETIDATNIDEIEQEVVKDRDISLTSAEDDKHEQAPQQGEALLDQSEATEVIEAENKESTTIDVAESVQATENPKDISELTEELVPHTQEKTESKGVESTEIVAAELTEEVTEKGKIEQSVTAEEPKEVDENTIVAVTEASDATTDHVKETIDSTNIDETEKEVVKDRDFSLTSAEDDQQEQAPQQGEALLDQSEATEVIEAENKKSTTIDVAESVQATETPKEMSEVTVELVTHTQVAEKLNNEILETAEAAEEPLEEIEGSKEAISAETLAPEPMEGGSEVEQLEGFEQVQEEPKDFDVITTASTEASAEATDQVKEVIEEASNDEELEEEEPKEVDVIKATSSIEALAQETNQVKEVIAASNDEKPELEAVKDRDFSQISEQVDQEQIHQQGEAAKDQSIAIEVLEADSKETATVDTVESTEASEKTQEILGGAEEVIPRTQAAKELKVEIQEAMEETKAEEFWEETEESGKVKGTDTLPKEQTEQIVDEEKLEPASEVQEESKEAGITMIAATAAAAEETELEMETTDTAIVGEKGLEFGKEREFSLTSAEEEQQELAGEVQEKSKGVDITTIAAPEAAADDTEWVNETTEAAIVGEAKQEVVKEREFSETFAEEEKQELASEVQDKSKEVDITTIAATAAGADETELAKGTAEAAILGESEQELVKEREFPEASAGVEQQEQAPQQGEAFLDQSEAPKVIDAESKELIDGVTKETGIFLQDAEKAGEIAKQADYSGKKETQENQETEEKTRLEESSKELIEGERVKEFVKEAVVEEGKPLLEAKSDTAEEEKLEDSAPTNELVQQATEQVENKITTFPTKEVPKSITDAVIVSRDVEFILETKQENFLKEPQSEHKDSEANDESPDEDHEEPHVKHKHSHNIFSKVRRSFVKAKKAIIGKHPKPASSETKENQS